MANSIALIEGKSHHHIMYDEMFFLSNLFVIINIAQIR